MIKGKNSNMLPVDASTYLMENMSLPRKVSNYDLDFLFVNSTTCIQKVT